MVRCPSLLACILPGVAVGFSSSAPAASPRSLVVTGQQIADDDSIAATFADGTTLRPRPLGIDTPEIPPTARSRNSTPWKGDSHEAHRHADPARCPLGFAQIGWDRSRGQEG